MSQSQYWTETEHRRLEHAQSFAKLADIALRILERMPQPIGQVCGPISTGGFGDKEKNFERFLRAVKNLMARGVVLFDQTPFEPAIWRLKDSRPNGAIAILEEFYQPLFRSGLINKFYFMSGWETSRGARWEYEQADHLGIERVYLKADDSL